MKRKDYSKILEDTAYLVFAGLLAFFLLMCLLGEGNKGLLDLF